MKRRLQALACAVALLLPSVTMVALVVPMTAGCRTTAVDPGSEAWVIETEAALQGAFNVVDAFLLWEANDRATAGPEITAVADDLRVSFPAAYDAAVNTLRTYKSNRDPNLKTTTAGYLVLVATAATRAATAYAEIKLNK